MNRLLKRTPREADPTSPKEGYVAQIRAKENYINKETPRIQSGSRNDSDAGTRTNIANLFNVNLNMSLTQSNYEKDRSALLNAEQLDAWDRSATETASSIEREAANIIWRIREHDREVLFGNRPGEEVPRCDTLDMGGQILSNLDRVEQSELFKIARQAPKGCQLHIHFNTEIETKELIRRACDMDTMYIRSTKALITQQDYDECEIVFNVLPTDTTSNNIFAKEYDDLLASGIHTIWMKWKDFCKKFPQSQGRTVEEWVSSKIALGEDEVYGTRQTLNGVWARFNQGTRCLKGLLGYESIFRWYIGALIDSMIQDRIIYAELRPMLLDKSIATDDGRQKLGQMDQILIMRDELEKKRRQLEHTGKNYEFPFGFKIIYCTPRSISRECMRKELQDCIRLKIACPELICGFDLVGAEDRPNPIRYYRDELLAFVETCKNLHISIPFMFHAGETLLDTGGSKEPENSNLYEALLLNAKRVGHGLALTKHPSLMSEFKKRRICVELCPTSNEMLHLCRNIKEHPFPQLLSAGIPCTLNTDNPALFRRSFAPGSSLSLEFYQVMVGNPMISLHSWRQLAEWSIEFSCLSASEKLEATFIFKEAWEDFCLWVTRAYRIRASTLEIRDGVL